MADDLRVGIHMKSLTDDSINMIQARIIKRAC